MLSANQASDKRGSVNSRSLNGSADPGGLPVVLIRLIPECVVNFCQTVACYLCLIGYFMFLFLWTGYKYLREEMMYLDELLAPRLDYQVSAHYLSLHFHFRWKTSSQVLDLWVEESMCVLSGGCIVDYAGDFAWICFNSIFFYCRNNP